MRDHSETKIKLENKSRVDTSFAHLENNVHGSPYRLRIEISNICNLRCTFAKDVFSNCSQWEINKTPVLMSFRFFKRIIDEVGIYLTASELYNYGEPFINPYAIDMIRYLKKINPGVIIEMHTNGHYFETESKRLDLVNSGLDVLSFSVDGITQEIYERYRVGGNLEIVTEAIRKICHLKKVMDIKNPKIKFQFVIFEHNLHQALNVKDFAKELGVDEVVIKTDFFNIKSEFKNSHRFIYENILSLQSKDSMDSFFKKDSEARHKFCDFPWVYPTILADGRVIICCRDRYYRSVVGIIKHNKTLSEIWNGDNYRDFRKKFLTNEQTPYPCCECGCRHK